METPKPSRRERRAQERASWKEQETARQSRRTLLKRLAAGAGVVGVGGTAVAVARSTELRREKSFKEKILSFTWKDAENPEKLRAFVELLADEYLRLTQTPRLTKEDLEGVGKTSFYKTTDSYLQEIRAIEPEYNRGQNEWGYTHYESRKVFIDLESLKKQVPQNSDAGISLLTAIWHEWGHLDVVGRTTGELMNNPSAYFNSPNSGQNELFTRYRGGVVYTDTYFGYRHFDEVWNETINARRIAEQVGLDRFIAARDYYQNGVDFFPKFISTIGIPLKTIYEMHATSDFEGFAKLVGKTFQEINRHF